MMTTIFTTITAALIIFIILLVAYRLFIFLSVSLLSYLMRNLQK